MTTDGCLSKDGRHLEFTSKDKEQVENLKKCLSVTARTAQKKGRAGSAEKYYHVQWGDVTLYRFLVDLGLMPNKSLQLKEIGIPEKYFWDFLRGHFDGDGSFYSYFDPRWPASYMFYVTFISAAESHLLWLQARIFAASGSRGHIVRPKSGTPSLRFAKREGEIVLRRMYTGGVCLTRKRLKIQKAMRIVNQPLYKE